VRAALATITLDGPTELNIYSGRAHSQLCAHSPHRPEVLCKTEILVSRNHKELMIFFYKMSVSYLMCLLACTVQACLLVDCEFYGGGLLYPYESESRQIQLLNGMWNFRADTSDCRCEGLVEQWYLKPLSEVCSFPSLLKLAVLYLGKKSSTPCGF